MLRRVNPSAEARALAGDRALPIGSHKIQGLSALAVAVIVRPWFALNLPGYWTDVTRCNGCRF